MIIFIESRRTQEYLWTLLADSDHGGGCVLVNGSNGDPLSRRIYAGWRAQHQGSSRVSGSHTSDTRAALVEYFCDHGRIVIATEAGAEGINLQFCSRVINYDLPWNPQRIEQRIGRCHRYGQKHDVVVVNFLNRDNDADRRVYALLEQKFKLFDGVFGASDEVLGAVASGVDFERRIADIYQHCRHPIDIHQAFEQLQLDLAGEISDAMLNARKVLLENFDEEVAQRLKTAQTDAKASLDPLEQLLMRFTRTMLTGYARFDADGLMFDLLEVPASVAAAGVAAAAIPCGRYELPRRSDEAHVYRLQHPLAQGLLQATLAAPLPLARLHLDYEAYGAQVAALKAVKGAAGRAVGHLVQVQSLGTTEEFLLAAASVDEQILDAELTDKLVSLPGRAELLRRTATATPPGGVPSTVATDSGRFAFAAAPIPLPPQRQAALDQQCQSLNLRIEPRNLALLSEESDKLDAWADDLKVGLERKIKGPDRRVKETRSKGKSAATLAEKLASQTEQRELESTRDRKRREPFARQDQIQARRDKLIEEMESPLAQHGSARLVLDSEWVMS